jgi:hypothetical protein
VSPQKSSKSELATHVRPQFFKAVRGGKEHSTPIALRHIRVHATQCVLGWLNYAVFSLTARVDPEYLTVKYGDERNQAIGGAGPRAVQDCYEWHLTSLRL